MDDDQIHGRIEQLVTEEHELWDRESQGGGSNEDRTRLDAIGATLDQCWDLLRQRRAHEQYGLDTSDTGVRPAEVVENYEQ